MTHLEISEPLKTLSLFLGSCESVWVCVCVCACSDLWLGILCNLCLSEAESSQRVSKCFSYFRTLEFVACSKEILNGESFSVFLSVPEQCPGVYCVQIE